MPILKWLTRDEDVRAAAAVPYRLIEEVPELSYGDVKTGNMLIQGDNLDALKALLPYYAGQVKCVYIDPPYNTGAAFEHYDDNLEHSKWLSMMWPRVELLRELLTENGVLLISLNDDEVHYLKVICDEIFGRKAFKGSFIWHYEGNTDNQAQIINYHEHILIYCKGQLAVTPGVVDPNTQESSKLNNPEIRNTVVKNGPKNPSKPVLIPAGFPTSLPNGEFKPDKSAFPKWSASLQVKDGKTITDVIATSGWSSRKILEDFIGNNFKPVLDSKGQHTRFEITHTGAIEYIKTRRQDKGHIVSVLRGFGTTNKNRMKLEKLGLSFTYPKPVDLITYLIRVFSSGNDLVLDSFLGSGTTAHATLEANRIDGANRKFIAIEMLKRNAEEIAQSRLKAVISGHKKAEIEKTGGGFRFYRLGPPVFTEDGQIQPDIRFPVLAAHIWFAETGQSWHQPDDLSPFLGECEKKGYALLYNGILGDKSASGGNVLTRKTLSIIRSAQGNFKGTLIVYGERTALSETTLKSEQIEFKQTPYDVKARK
ncbi:site-specific DNA-methyltransferase [Pseudidiomarina gelatinasegens]|uniref:site-specific DNA-methyltransferase (adenine-specific) n=1 Tax=Pseudidiomarina gelatinasegens TaxID=2487740 RepID=A0A443YYL9_9GAMM|nr:site-specific DNA-methyltransferase [Pseudidiomarina gelatinasegens]RWU09213.1 site-specific DNA-methyltransferase [Pseudidiomarina gelatinasegens]